MRTVTDDPGRPQVEQRVRSLFEGFTIERVQYLAPRATQQESVTGGVGFDQAESGVQLTGKDGRSRTIRWAQDGFDEELWIGEESKTEHHQLWSPDVRALEVGTWSEVATGAVIDHVSVSWQHIGPSRFSVWAVRLTMGGASVVVSLGERDFESGRPSYIPDCILVIFDEQVARSYEPRASSASAWGSSSDS